MISAGMLMFVVFSWQMSGYNLDVSAGSLTTTLIWRGVGLAMTTVPLSVLAVSSLAPADFAQGAALNNMMRQLVGSFGLAMVNTYLANRNAVHRADLVSNITADNPLAVKRLADYTQFFISKGAGAADAHARALRLMDAGIARQTSVLSFDDAYLLIGLVFLCSLPLLLMASRKKKGAKVQVVLADH
jgi:DHA2 family multidrug resistance protein